MGFVVHLLSCPLSKLFSRSPSTSFIDPVGYFMLESSSVFLVTCLFLFTPFAIYLSSLIFAFGPLTRTLQPPYTLRIHITYIIILLSGSIISPHCAFALRNLSIYLTFCTCIDFRSALGKIIPPLCLYYFYVSTPCILAPILSCSGSELSPVHCLRRFDWAIHEVIHASAITGYESLVTGSGDTALFINFVLISCEFPDRKHNGVSHNHPG
ncbi:hypothetical protein B0H10DRAFT_647984 [Mycena sp. CBHHK59/15]|nr:hypothetical protein B0H10DRAFT_647984 [Mycena sp. CBHHK59/15]